MRARAQLRGNLPALQLMMETDFVSEISCLKEQMMMDNIQNDSNFT
jgi:hypothetical protein